MRKPLFLALCAIFAVMILCAVNYAQEAKRPDGDDATAVDMGEYEYVVAKTLDEEIVDYVGKYVKIVDLLAVVWDDPTPHDSAEERDEAEQKGHKGEYDNQTLTKQYQYLKFETKYMRCLLPEEFEGSVNYVKELNSEVVHDDVTQIKAKKKYICLYGKVIRTTVWGDIAERGEGEVEPEAIVLMVHKAEPAPERFNKDVPNEEDQ